MNELCEAMDGVVTAEIAHCIRDAEVQGFEVHTGDYIGITGKEYIASDSNRLVTACLTADKLGISDYDICNIISGKNVTGDEAEKLEKYISDRYPRTEIYTAEGMQEIYDYIIILQ